MNEDDLEGSGPVVGSGDFLADRGYADPAEARRRFMLANEVALLVEARGLTPALAAGVAGLELSDMERIVEGRVKDVPAPRLAAVLDALSEGTPAPAAGPARTGPVG